MNKQTTLHLTLPLGKKLDFANLFHSDGLQELDNAFLAILTPQQQSKLLQYRQPISTFTALETSELLLELSPILEKFLGDVFAIDEALAIARAKTISHNPVSAFKNYFVLRRAKKLLQKIDTLKPFDALNAWLNDELKIAPIQTQDHELAVSLLANGYLQDAEKYINQIDMLTQWCARAMTDTTGQRIIKNWVSFHLPQRIDVQQLVNKTPDIFRHRDGFGLTDERMSARAAQDEVNYCIYCHDHEGDFCSRGFPVKKGEPELGFKKNALDVTLTGCPLEEKISEMHQLKRDGYTLAALAMIMIDNPLCPATGHRICNDCMKACIYQKQDPVNIPQTETRILTDALALPWGVEIYDLLTRWHPLRKTQWIMKPYNGCKILIAGMGPAGFTLAHHLLLEGFAVVGFDGLKIEPLPRNLVNTPIYAFDDLIEKLDERFVTGFGGVAEYGITVRWDKNFLKLIYLSLMRKPTFQVFGSTRFGGTVTVEDAFAMGFDHLAIAVGAGLPKALDIPGSLAPGMRQANDFLMALQLGNAARADSLSSLQVRLPAIIIGGGLTGVDTATEVQAYYICQAEKTLLRYEELIKIYSEETVLNKLDIASRDILQELLSHGKQIRAERQRAQAVKERPNFISLLRAWGGVTIVYRRTMQASPAYIHNHEELQKALEEGIYYLENLEPVEAERDAQGQVSALLCHETTQSSGVIKKLPARSIFVATGTKPNIAYEFEHRGTFARNGFHYQHYEMINNELVLAHGVTHCKDPAFGPFTSYNKKDQRVSLVGDTHPVFHGSVVKAIASGMRTWPKIVAILEDKINKNKTSHQTDYQNYLSFAEKIKTLFSAKVESIKQINPNIIELKIKAPLAAKKFKPGQFFRLQNFETRAPSYKNTRLQIEPLALTASGVDPATGTLSFMVLTKGASSKLCALLKTGEPVSLMGPTGVRARLAEHPETVLIAGDQSSLAMLQAYGPALRAQGNRVLYLGLFKSKEELYCQGKIEESTDVAIWVTESDEKIPVNRVNDISVANSADPIAVLVDYATGKLNKINSTNHKDQKILNTILLEDIDRVLLIGNTSLLRSFQAARQERLKPYFVKDPRFHGSVYSTMQCMLKGVCAQCLQWQVDPETGKRTKAVFACSWPEQPLELIDFANIDERQSQNRLLEILNELWVDEIIKEIRNNLMKS